MDLVFGLLFLFSITIYDTLEGYLVYEMEG